MTIDQLLQLASQPIAAGEIIHRLPPMRIDPVTFSADQLSEKIDWGLASNNIPDVWKLTAGEGIKVAILDTGQANHPDLPQPIFVENFSRSPTPFDQQGHSTHVAGTLGARKDGSGVVGVAPEVGIGFIKVLGDDGSGTSTAIAKGIYSAIAHKVDIISMSLGGGYDPRIAQACLDAVQAGIFVICAAGNDGQQGSQNTIGYPARLGFTIAIASYNRDGMISEFSSRGPEIDAAFPGEQILSTWPGGGYKTISGTSMATPFAAGLVALRLAYQRKNAGAKQIKNNADLKAELKATSKDRGPVGFDNDWGWGIPDANGFVRGGAQDQPVPGVPVVPAPGGPVINLGPFGVEWPHTTQDGRVGGFVWLK